MAEEWQTEQLADAVIRGIEVGALDARFQEASTMAAQLLGKELAGAIQTDENAQLFSPAMVERGKTTHTGGILITDRRLIIARSEGRLRSKEILESFDRSVISNVRSIRRTPKRIMDDMDGVAFDCAGQNVDFFMLTNICTPGFPRLVLGVLDGSQEIVVQDEAVV